MGQTICSELSGGEIKHGTGLGVDGPLWVPGAGRTELCQGERGDCAGKQIVGEADMGTDKDAIFECDTFED